MRLRLSQMMSTSNLTGGGELNTVIQQGRPTMYSFPGDVIVDVDFSVVHTVTTSPGLSCLTGNFQTHRLCFSLEMACQVRML